ncbi:hypothetical protein JCM1841_004866 [Sporobolomyces salmonicolor]
MTAPNGRLGSIIHTASIPTFDPATGQLALAAHHLISAPLSYAASFSPRCTLLMDSPLAKPYQSAPGECILATATSAPDEVSEPKEPRRKRRRTGRAAEDATPADWHRVRQKEGRKTTTDKETELHHASIVLGLEAAIDAVRDGSKREGRQGWIGELGGKVKWVEKEEQQAKELDLVSQGQKWGKTGAKDVLRLEGSTTAVGLDEIFGRIVVNSHNELLLDLNQPGQRDDDAPTNSFLETASLFRLVLPPSSGFLLSDFSTWSSPSSGIASLGLELGGWDIVIIDPPWPNASASRSASYDTFDPYDLWKLDMQALLGDRPVLVAVWLTNRVKYRRLVMEKLFPAWKVEPPVEWYWIKIAAETGEPVWPLDATHRRCYEGLVVGWYNPTKADLPALPHDKVFLSTPIGHSRKPVLLDLLEPLLPSSPSPANVLELFARTTLGGYLPSSADQPSRKRGFCLSVGNEAIKFNLCNAADPAQSQTKGWIELTKL